MLKSPSATLGQAAAEGRVNIVDIIPFANGSQILLPPSTQSDFEGAEAILGEPPARPYKLTRIWEIFLPAAIVIIC